MLLVQLQSQLSEDDDIYVVSPDKKGVGIVKQYGSTRSTILVEVSKCDWQKALAFAWQSMIENKQDGILCLSENLIISSTFIANLKRAIKSDFDILSPHIIFNPYNHFPNEFRWYNHPATAEEGKAYHECMYIKNGKSHDSINTGIFAEKVVLLTNTPNP